MKSKMARGVVTLSVVTLAASGCAVSQKNLRDNPSAYGDAAICRALQGRDAQADRTFSFELRRELAKRNIGEYSCDEIIQKQNAVAGVAVLLGAAIAIAASRGGGGASSYSSGQVDYSWDWDQFYNQYRQLVWACRGVQTGQFAESHRCIGKYQTDYRWPSKEAP